MRSRAMTVAGILAVWAAAAAPAAAARWTIVPTPSLDGKSAQLVAVSCTSREACTAVGSYFDSAGDEFTLAERWNGRRWVVQSTPNPPSAPASLFSGVSCASAASCTAVGRFTSSAGSGQTLVENWNGGAWSIVPSPNPADSEGAGLDAISCRRLSRCVAVGGYVSSTAATEVGLAEVWDGSSWSIVPTPNPSGSLFSNFASVSCVSDRTCVAVGNWETPGLPFFAPLAEEWDGSTWAIQPTPNARGSRADGFAAVSCVRLMSCHAVGSNHPNDAVNRTFAAQLRANWSLQPSFSPPGGPSSLNGLSCVASTELCWAVGGLQRSLDSGTTLAERLRAGRWIAQPTPNPPGETISSLDGVSCPTPASCMAVGSATGRGFTLRTLAERLVGAS